MTRSPRFDLARARFRAIRTRRSRALQRGGLVLAVALGALGCSADFHARRADRSALGVLDERMSAVESRRAAEVRHPVERAPEPEPTEAPDAAGEGEPSTDYAPGGDDRPGVELLDLGLSLEIGVATNRDFLAQKEALFIQALNYYETRHAFSPLVSSSLVYAFADGNGIPEQHTGSWLADIRKILPTGGTLSADAVTGYFRSDDPAALDSRTFDSAVSVRLAQPLLRGAGYEASHEALTQAERNLLYAIRDFELFREDFSIDVARRYYDLVQQKQSIENVRRNLENLVFSERQAQSLFNVGRTSELDVLRARRSRLSAENDLLEARESYELALDRFKIFLGLSTDAYVDVEEYAPEFVPVTFDVRSAIEVAFHNRLDLLNRVEQVEDSERAVRLAENGLLPDLDLDARVTFPAGPDASFSNQPFEGENVALGLRLDLPVDRVNERGIYRRAQIALVQERRSLDEFEDDLVVDIESTFRELDRRQQSLEIQRQLIEDQQKNVRIAQLRFERGEIPNRDVVEAQQSLLDARNALIGEQVNYEIARLGLLRDLGILFIDERGMWTE